MPQQNEIEIKFRIEDKKVLRGKLRAAGFRQVTPRTRESNTLYDLPARTLRKRGEILRLRQYGKLWTVTHKAKGKAGAHKSRIETETSIADGEALAKIFAVLGYRPVFVYEKFRSEWTDGRGHVVMDETPVGDIAEIEGSADWIDTTARMLGIPKSAYLTSTYSDLFNQWKRATKSTAKDMTFDAIRESLGPAKSSRLAHRKP